MGVHYHIIHFSIVYILIAKMRSNVNAHSLNVAVYEKCFWYFIRQLLNDLLRSVIRKVLLLTFKDINGIINTINFDNKTCKKNYFVFDCDRCGGADI